MSIMPRRLTFIDNMIFTDDCRALLCINSNELDIDIWHWFDQKILFELWQLGQWWAADGGDGTNMNWWNKHGGSGNVSSNSYCKSKIVFTSWNTNYFRVCIWCTLWWSACFVIFRKSVNMLQRDITMSPRATTVVGWSSSLRALWWDARKLDGTTHCFYDSQSSGVKILEIYKKSIYNLICSPKPFPGADGRPAVLVGWN